MKKLILLGLTLMILGGCSSYGVKKSDDNTVSRSGIITEIGMSTWMYGSYVLSDESGKPMTALDGDEALDLGSYQGENVEVTGTLKEGYPIDGGPEYLEVKTIKKLN
jgi:hypothetical protein